MSRPPLWRVVVKAIRPRQWTKNAAVLAPLVFARSGLVIPLALKAMAGFAAFSFLASAIYVMNDWVDREKDRLHPEKKDRPIAARHLSGTQAVILGLSCLLLGSFFTWAVQEMAFLQVAAGYLLLQLAYTYFLKHWVIVDVMAIAAGFVLRVLGGAVAIDVPVSNWLFLCTLLLAVFLGFAKRRHEIASMADDAASHRKNLEEYSVPLLDQMMSVVAAACVVAYGLYSVAPDTLVHVGNDRMKYTVPFVIYGIFRYLFLVHRRGMGGSPEKVLLSDLGTIANLGFFTAVAAWALYF